MRGLKTVQTKALKSPSWSRVRRTGGQSSWRMDFPMMCMPLMRWHHIWPRLGARVIVPYLRGFGPTRFLSKETMRSGQQAALGHDLVDLLDALGVERAVLAGYDWGGCGSCVASAIWPERVAGLVSYAGYDVNDLERNGHAFAPALERVIWYQNLFQLERGRECLTLYRRDLCRLLWEEWSPGWAFDDATFERTAASFNNPDFVEVVIHCYRFHFGLTPGEPNLTSLEQHLASKPKIGVPAITLDGIRD